MEKSENTIPALPSSKRLGWLVHIIPWGIIMCLPILFLYGISTDFFTWGRYLNFLVTLVSFMLMFYINYYYLIPRYLFKRQTGMYLLMNVVLIIALITGDNFIEGLFPTANGPGEQMGPPHEEGSFPFEITWMQYLGAMLVWMAFYALIAAVSVAFKMTATWYATETARKELERSRSEAELQNLKSQLNPHFLFNTLNNIYSLIALSQERAQEAVHDLSRLLRYVMYESSQPLVTLEKDLNFVRNYVELMRIRLPEHVELKTNISSVVPGTLVAPLLYISLIENAFKHGVSNDKPSFIHIDITQEGNQVICSIANSDFHKDANQDKSGSGIGLVNLERRLALLYPGKHVYTYGPEGDTYRSYLAITVNE